MPASNLLDGIMLNPWLGDGFIPEPSLVRRLHAQGSTKPGSCSVSGGRRPQLAGLPQCTWRHPAHHVQVKTSNAW